MLITAGVFVGFKVNNTSIILDENRDNESE